MNRRVKQKLKDAIPEMIIAAWFLGAAVYALFWAWAKIS